MQNFFSKNIRYLRKLNKWSQEELADKLDIKRSSIAAYECKNVEPRLELMLRISRLFNVLVSDLVQKDFETTGYQPTPPRLVNEINGGVEDSKLDSISKKCEEIKALHEGFKTYYQIRKQNAENASPEIMRLMMDIDTFSMLLDQLFEFNEQLIDLSKTASE
ncbi:MAG TPA: helix-turn-helix transcriptional regulator [Saprospiraceae bacterium]|nr:helix-turn-helix transcriptional regulator [Saprospiraceae bacterium]